MSNVLMPLLGTLIRHGLTMAGGAGLIVEDDMVAQATSAVAILIGIGLSIYNARKKK